MTYRVAQGSILPIVGGGLMGGGGAPAGATVVSDVIGKSMFKNKKTCTNSRECAREQLAIAKGGWNATSMQALGLALHYMTDATQPMHTSGYDGFKIPNNLHLHYEYYAPYVQGQFAAEMTWDKRWSTLNADQVFHQAAVKSNTFAPRLMKALHLSGDAGIVTIQGFNGIGPYTGYNLYNDKDIDSVTGDILRDACHSTASYLYAVAKVMGSTVESAPPGAPSGLTQAPPGSGGPSAPTVLTPPQAPSKPTSRDTTLEARCAQAIQGQVAWNRAGTKDWAPGNIAALCEGTTDPGRTIACFSR